MEIQIMAIISSSLIKVLFLTLATAPTSALAGETGCPRIHAGSKLTTVTLFDGPPSEHADLMPDSFRKIGNGSQSGWDVAYIFEAGRQLFVECQYGPKVSTVILEPGPSTYKCEFLSRGEKNVSLTCQSH
jgi:hypothetical protein